MNTSKCVKALFIRARSYMPNAQRQELLRALESDETALLCVNKIRDRRALIGKTPRVKKSNIEEKQTTLFGGNL